MEDIRYGRSRLIVILGKVCISHGMNYFWRKAGQ